MTGKIIDFVSHAEAAKAVPLQAKLEAYQRVIREWSGHLTVNEFVVLIAVTDRTIGWGKREARFRVSALLSGDTVYARLPIKRTAIFDALASLEAKGVIHRRRDRSRPDHVHFRVNINWKPGTASLLEYPEGTESGSATRTNPSAIRTGQSATRTLYTVSDTVIENGSQERAVPARSATEEKFCPGKEERPQPQTPSPRPRKPLADPVTLIREKAANAQAIERARQADEKAGRTSPSPATKLVIIEGAWRDAILEAFPHNVIPVWGVREKAQAKQAAAKFLHHNQITFPAFVAWAATNWTAIMRKQFKWMTKSPPPAVPAWGFFIAQLHQFAECWGERKLEAWLSDTDRTEIEKAMGRGATWEQAVAQLSEAKAKGVLRQEMDKRELDVRIREAAAELKMARAQKLADYAGNAPVHPRSRAAMRMKREAEQAANPLPPPEPTQGDFTGFVPAPLLPEKCPFDDE
ncbi:hypothetical protein GCM10019060_37310 [Novosphingobium pokkalii]|nr:hypothetical protein GCM10019060_37310 [Novosphingobium pokkalii]